MDETARARLDRVAAARNESLERRRVNNPARRDRDRLRARLPEFVARAAAAAAELNDGLGDSDVVVRLVHLPDQYATAAAFRVEVRDEDALRETRLDLLVDAAGMVRAWLHDGPDRLRLGEADLEAVGPEELAGWMIALLERIYLAANREPDA